MIAGLLYMHSDYNLKTRSLPQRVDNLAKHEAGHSFGVWDGNPGDPPSIMGPKTYTTTGTAIITECDIAAHKRVYCPAQSTPTPTPEPTPPDGADLKKELCKWH
jgi:predicted Zn-dependent protease